MQSKITRDCPICHSSFSFHASQLKYSPHKYCSRACVSQARASGEVVWRRHGPVAQKPEEVFWKHLTKTDTCWIVRYRPDKNGYSRLRDASRKKLLAHRFAYELLVGPIPEGLDVLHTCDNPPCCNPDHLYVGTDADNVRDREQRGRRPPPENRKLTQGQAEEIRARYAAGGVSQQSLADEFGIPQTGISKIIRGKHYR